MRSASCGIPLAAPQCYTAYAFRGDAKFFQGNREQALVDYNRAIALNPDDASIYTYRANAYVRLGLYAQALADLQLDLALRPRFPPVLDMLQAGASKLNITVHDVSFHPRAFARDEAGAIHVYVQEKHQAWLGYGMCKGFWLGEPAHRQEMTGSRDHGFSMAEERECLQALLNGYAVLHSKPGDAQEPSLDKLTEIVNAGFGNEWIIYELASRVDPQIVIKQPKQVRERMLEFVKRYVAVPKNSSNANE